MYIGSSFGFQYRKYVELARLNVMSRKCTIFRFASAVIFRPSPLKIWIKSFLALLASCLLLVFKTARLSSLYRLIFLLPNLSSRLLRIYQPTSSQTSAPSKLPMVTSNVEEEPFLTHGLSLENRRDLHACMMTSMCFFRILTFSLAQVSALVRRFSVMDG